MGVIGVPLAVVGDLDGIMGMGSWGGGLGMPWGDIGGLWGFIELLALSDRTLSGIFQP